MVMNVTESLTVSTVGGCGGLERNDSLTVDTLGKVVVVLKKLVFNS